MMPKAKYSSIVAVLRQCDRSRSTTRHDGGTSLNSNYANGEMVTVAVGMDVVALLDQIAMLLTLLR